VPTDDAAATGIYSPSMLYVALGGQALLVAGAFWAEARTTRGATGASVRGALIWSGAWLALGLLPALWFGLFDSPRQAGSYSAVYLIERALSLDNVFVFAVLIATFQIPTDEQSRLVSFGAIAAFALRVPAILLGVAVFDASHVVGYVLGGLLIVLAWQTARSHGKQSTGPNRVVEALRRRLPLSEHVPRRWLVVRNGRREVTPLLLCLIAIMLADLTFAVDSIPAALAISNDTTLLLTGNLLALLGLRALFQLVAIARERLLYMDQTVAVLLLLVGVKLLAGGVLHVGPLESLASVVLVLAVGTAVSLRATRPGKGGPPVVRPS
jgi:tellurite resistance protein TerC